jgi:hypothetical protein
MTTLNKKCSTFVFTRLNRKNGTSNTLMALFMQTNVTGHNRTLTNQPQLKNGQKPSTRVKKHSLADLTRFPYITTPDNACGTNFGTKLASFRGRGSSSPFLFHNIYLLFFYFFFFFLATLIFFSIKMLNQQFFVHFVV